MAVVLGLAQLCCCNGSMLLFLRWSVGIASAAALIVFVLIVTVGKGLGSPYQSGASGENLARAAATFGLPVLLAMMLGSVFVPHSRSFLHLVAFFVIAAALGCGTLIPSHPGEAFLYIGFFGMWIVYYALAVWARG